jgi:UDP-glucose 4-epimerase
MGTGEQTRDWTFVSDIVNGLLKAGLSDAAVGQPINLGTGKETQVIDVARQINLITANPAGLVFRAIRRWDAHHRRSARTDKAVRLLFVPSAIAYHRPLAPSCGTSSST